jgi:hypothetical protein
MSIEQPTYVARVPRLVRTVTGCALLVFALLMLTTAYSRTVIASAEGRSLDGTIVSQNIVTNTTWTKAGSPYTISGACCAVEKDATFIIEPGVQVMVSPDRIFRVRGTLVADGTANEPIIFTGATKEAGSWGGRKGGDR